MALQPTTRTTNGEGLRKMNDIFDSMYENLLKMGNSVNKPIDNYSSIQTNKQQTVESNLLDQRKDNYQTVRKQPKNNSLDIILLQEEINQLKKQISIKDRIIKELQGKGVRMNKDKSPIGEMEKQIKFLAQNNQTLYRTTYKLEQQILELKQKLEIKGESEKRMSQMIGEYEKQIEILKKLSKEMLMEQKQMVRNEIKDVNSFRHVKNRYEKQNDLLKGKLYVMEVERQKEIRGFRKSLNKSIDRYMSAQNPSPAMNYKLISPSVQTPATTVAPPISLGENEVNQLKDEIACLKRSVNELSSRKKLSRNKSMSSTPIKKKKL